MIRQLTIENFKGLQSLKLSDLGRVTVLGGKNNVGKTSLLEAIFLALDRADAQVFVKELLWRGADSIAIGEAMWLPFFADLDSSKKIKIGFTNQRGKIQTMEITRYVGPPTFAVRPTPNAQGGVIVPRENQLQPAGDALSVKVARDGKTIQDSTLRIFPNQFGFEHKVFDSNESLLCRAHFPRTPTADEVEVFSRIDSKGKTSQVIETLRRIDERITDISVGVEHGTPKLFVKLDSLPRKLPIFLLGDGIRRITSMVVGILDQEKSVILVDEIENGIHHSNLANMWKAVYAAADMSQSQIIATTHSRECLAAAHSVSEEFEGALVYFRLQRSKKDSSIRVERYSDEELAYAIESELEVR